MKISKARRLIQFFSTLLHNAYLGFPITGNIYTGSLKRFCAPGLNCYSCPAAFFSCPLGSIQQVLISLRVLSFQALLQPLFYVLGTILLFSLALGRFICGWFCPFGLLQDLLYKIPFYKKNFHLPLRAQRYLKYALLIFFVLLLPALWIGELGYGTLWFCKYFCPVGTLEAGFFNFPLKPELLNLVGKIFLLKSLLLLIILFLCLIEIRFFCKNLCPLGLIYGIFNRFSLLQLRWVKRACTTCTLCEKACPMGLYIPKELNSVECIRCLKCLEICPTKAIHLEKTFYYLPEKYQINLSVRRWRDEKGR